MNESLTPTQIDLIRRYKSSDSAVASRHEIQILKSNGTKVGFLSPINTSIVEDKSIMAALSRWRSRYKLFFQSQFDPTPEDTRSWLKNIVLKDDTRLLFLIQTSAGQPIGNFGICHLSASRAELDNLLRGEKGGDPELIYHTEISMIHWIYQNLGVEQVYLLIFDDNYLTIMMHRSIGFKEVCYHSLYRSTKDGKISFTTTQEDNAPLVKRRLLEMEIQKVDFYKMHSWVQELREMKY